LHVQRIDAPRTDYETIGGSGLKADAAKAAAQKAGCKNIDQPQATSTDTPANGHRDVPVRV
jgi:glycerol dehydrogenase-like iron-containing ADH family enzyme